MDNLKRHMHDHGKCIADLVNNPKIARDHALFALECDRTVKGAWGEYEAQFLEYGRYTPHVYFIDRKDLFVAVTADRTTYKTYYHDGCDDKNFGVSRHTTGKYRKENPGLWEQLNYAGRVSNKNKGGIYRYRNIRWVKPEFLGGIYAG